MTISLFIILLLLLPSADLARNKEESFHRKFAQKEKQTLLYRPCRKQRGRLRETLLPKSKGHNLLFPSSLNCKVVLLVL